MQPYKFDNFISTVVLLQDFCSNYKNITKAKLVFYLYHVGKI
jgi:hypothetical protein